MGTKADLVRDLTDGTGCIGKTAADEPIFVLCARDPLAGMMVRHWVTGAITHRVSPRKIADALDIGTAMDDWYLAHVVKKKAGG